MRKVILNVAVSLDNYIEGPQGEYDWCLMDQDYGMKAFLARIDTLFMGRKTYEMALKMGGSLGFPKLRKYIFSNTIETVEKGNSLIKGDIERQVREIKEQKGKDIWLFGGASLTTTLMNLGLVDELLLAVHPIILGGGKPLFSGITKRTHLRLLDSIAFSSGLVSLAYTLHT